MSRLQRILVTTLISSAGIIAALFVIYVLIGIGFIIPLLEQLQQGRLFTGNTPSIWEASVVFLIVVLYMFILTVGVIAGGLSGWVFTHLQEHGGFSMTRLRNLFRIEEPD